MEHSVENSGGSEISKKSRSLDLQSIYRSKVSQEGDNKILKRKHSSENDGEVESGQGKKKSNSRKAVSLSSLKSLLKNSHKSLDEVYADGLGSGSSSGLPDSKKKELGLSQKLDDNSGLNSISRNLDNNVIRIPKRPRGFVRRRRFDGNHMLQPGRSSPASSKDVFVDQITKLSDDSATRVVPLKIKRKKGFDDFKENRSSGSSSAPHYKEGDEIKVVDNGNSSLRKRMPRKKQVKRKNLSSEGKSIVKEEAVPLADNPIKNCDEEDEENLEENAARMLSSRFDPNCTGFSSNGKASTPQSTNGLSFLLSPDQDCMIHRMNSLVGSESASVDTAGRVLRPRKQHKQKGLSRKRRHFYEIFSRNLDAYWVLNRRIKVFWPLDQSWYFGLVKDYDPERKLHHVKYDDRDEEWIDLRHERFKLLLLPSEVPGKADRKKMEMGDKCPDDENEERKRRKRGGKRDLPMEDDSCIGGYMDSEPIISWLARSSRRIKSSPFHVMKKQKTSCPSSNAVPSLLSDNTDSNAQGCLDGSSLKRDKDRLNNSAMPDEFTDAEKIEKSVPGSTICYKDEKVPIVYFRRRLKRFQGLHYVSEVHNVCGSASELVPSPVPVIDRLGTLEEFLLSLRQSDQFALLWSSDGAGLLKLSIPMINSRHFRFEFSLPALPVLNCAFGAENFWLFHTVLLHQYGVVMPKWPKVRLEMLFVDNLVGLRFLLFEGCLKQAVAFVCLVLTIFNQPNEQGRYVDLQFPVTSIKFKLSCVQDLQKQLVFAFYNFSKVKDSKWFYLDCKLKRYCLLTKQLPLSECTYDNIMALQSGTNPLFLTSAWGEPASTECPRKRSRLGVIHMGVSRESTFVNMSQSSSSLDVNQGKLPPFALSFNAAPTFFLGLHLKLLMEHRVDSTCLHDHNPTSPKQNLESLTEDVTWSGQFSGANPQIAKQAQSACNDDDRINSFQKYENSNLNVAGTSACSEDTGETGIDAIVQLQEQQGYHSEAEQCILSPQPLLLNGHSSNGKSNVGCYSRLNGINVQIPTFDQVEKSFDRGADISISQQSVDLSWNVNDGVIRSPNPTAPRSMWQRNKNSFSSSFGYPSHMWSDGKGDFFGNGFGNGPKKPRTQVSYTLPVGGFDFSSKQRSHHQKGLPNKRIRRANEKRLSDGSRSSQRNLESLSCEANVLITFGDRGWRESGAQVILELGDHNEWKLAVKVSGATKYSYKAHQFLQPGTANRFTHAMMWKGGKDWILEFPDRNQWALFKEMHEECYNRNVRAASVKNIPIPGVCLIEEIDDNGTEVPFVRNSPKYFRQIETDVDMALDPSRILYDMDSDDEHWISKIQNSTEVNEGTWEEFSEDMFEKVMDMFEKAAYVQQCDEFTFDELDELMVGFGPTKLVRIIHEYWQRKRQKKGMPLIRHLQPPLWEMYQQQLKEWEQAMIKNNTVSSHGWQEKVASIEKPAMFAFCLKPRGLEVLNKGSKQRSHRKFPVAGQSNANLGDQDGFHAFGRRLNGYAVGDEKAMFPGHYHESSDASQLFQSSTRVFSPRDAGSTGYFSLSSDGSEWSHHPRLHRNKSKKMGAFLPSSDIQMGASYSHRTIGKRNGVHGWNMGLPEWPSQKHYQLEVSQRHNSELLDGSDLDEFRLRDASGAAQHALNMAKLKREKAQRFLYRADLAIHKAVVALMTAEAIKASSEDLNGDG